MAVDNLTFEDFVGNESAVKKVKLLADDATRHNGKLPHMGFWGAPGNGKTTMARIVADHIGRNFVYINSVAVKTPMIFRGLLTNPENMMKGAVVVLDECHRLPPSIQDNLLSLLEEPALLVTAYKDQIIRDPLPDHISFIFCTTHIGLVRSALQSRLEHVEFHEYNVEQKQMIAMSYLNRKYGLTTADIDFAAIINIGRRSRSGRHVVKNCDNTIRYMRSEGINRMTSDVVNLMFDVWQIDNNGLTPRDKLLLGYLAETGQCGLDTLSALMDMPKRDIKEQVEPWLLRRRFMIRQSNGRAITPKGVAALNGAVVDV